MQGVVVVCKTMVQYETNAQNEGWVCSRKVYCLRQILLRKSFVVFKTSNVGGRLSDYVNVLICKTVKLMLYCKRMSFT